MDACFWSLHQPLVSVNMMNLRGEISDNIVFPLLFDTDSEWMEEMLEAWLLCKLALIICII